MVSPQLAIVIPVYKHSVLMSEAVQSGLREAVANDGILVIVNDGCPFEETHEIALAYSDSYPGIIDYIRTRNGGLSAARNRGIKHALVRFPSVQAIYLLDADNRLSPGSMGRALRVMQEVDADWVYPNIDKFGLEWSGDFAASYSLFRHLFQNICEAGSLVHRRVFDSGLSFDENMRQGYEDWEFWLQCADAGFRGVPCEDLGFQYRARQESMVRDANRDGEEILAYMHRKHKRLFTWKNILKLEHLEAPRYCHIDLNHDLFRFTSIPGDSQRSGPLEDMDKSYWQSAAYPVRNHFPNFIIAGDSLVLKELKRWHVLDWVFWQIEDLLQDAAFVFVALKHADNKLSFTVDADTPASKKHGDIHLVGTDRKCLHECVLDPRTDWINSLKLDMPQPRCVRLTVFAPFSSAVLEDCDAANGIRTLFSSFHQIRDSVWRQGSGAWDWRTQHDGLIPLKDLYLQSRKHMRAFAPLARCSVTNDNEVAFLLPVLSFGGVEQVAIQVAKQFRAAGWHTRVIITECQDIPVPERLVDVFDTVCFLNDPAALAWSPTGRKYYGHDMQTWDEYGKPDRMIGLVAGCAAAITFQARHGNRIMGWLRKQGVVTATSLHLFDRDKLLSPVGHPYLTLAYEHAYEIITSPSRSLIATLSALGLPRQKLVYLPNMPTFTVDEAMRQRRLEDVASSVVGAKGRPLNVLSIGRLDRQKGVERLAAVMQEVHRRGLPIKWQIVGSSIIGDTLEVKDDLSDVTIRPSIYERAKVIEAMLWADAIILLSHWEGSPLIILEAKSLGVIPIATDVGGVREMLTPNMDGISIRHGGLSAVIDETVEALQRLLANNAWRIQLATTACIGMAGSSWTDAAKEFVGRVTAATEPAVTSLP